MNKNLMQCFNKFLLLTGFILLSACGGGGGGGVGGGGGGGGVTFPPPATQPPGSAVIITAGNAEEEAFAAHAMIQSLVQLDGWVGSADATVITIGDIARIIKAMAQKLNGAGAAAGVAWDYLCANDATATGDDTIDVGDNTEGRFAGSMSFNGCDDGWGFPIDGTVVYDYSWFANGDYSDHFGGDLIMTTLSTDLTGMDYTDNGRLIGGTGNFSLTLTFALSTPLGGYLMQTPTAIAGTYIDPPCALSGEALVTGGNDTQLSLTFSGGSEFTVKWYDGIIWSLPLPNNAGVFDCWWF